MRIFLLILIFSIFSQAQTYRLNQEKLPFLEAGFGVGFANLPYYAGAKETRNFVLPFPAFIYRGKIFRSDENGGWRGRLIDNEYFEINTSFGLGIPVNSDRISVRSDMPDIDTVFELGPGFIFHLFPKNEKRNFRLSVSLGLRYAFSTDLSRIDARGWSFSPRIFSWWQITNRFTLYNGVGGKWTDSNFANYYYGVDEQFSNPSRTRFDAVGGNESINYSNFMIYNFTDELAVYTGIFYENYSMAQNRDSPLHVVNEAFSLVLGFTYWFYQSKELTQAAQ